MLKLLLFLVIPFNDVVRDECDLLELNHCYDDFGNKRFDQQIFWEWNPDRSAYQVIDFRMVSVFRIAKQENDWRCRWGEFGIRREVLATSYIETWTQYDPERNDLVKHKLENRRKLTKPK